MTEQRFTYKQHYNAPLAIGEAFDGNKKLTVQEMVELLNEQQATINEYKKDNAKWRRKCLDLLVIIRTELLPRISDDEVRRLKEIVDNG